MPLGSLGRNSPDWGAITGIAWRNVSEVATVKHGHVPVDFLDVFNVAGGVLTCLKRDTEDRKMVLVYWEIVNLAEAYFENWETEHLGIDSIRGQATLSRIATPNEADHHSARALDAVLNVVRDGDMACIIRPYVLELA